jgi:predicted RND superfamily exporter protein
VLPKGSLENRKRLMSQIRQVLQPLAIDSSRRMPVDRADLQKSLDELLGVFERALDMVATIKGKEEMTKQLDQITNALFSASEAARKAPEAWDGEFSKAQERVWRWMGARMEELDRMLAAGPVTEENLPAEIIDHYKGPKSGRYLLYIYPAGSLEKRESLRRYVDSAQEIAGAVDTRATGYPVVFYASTELIHEGFSTAVSAAAVVIFITLFLDFGKISLVLLAALPKLIGIIWMLGIMRLLDINYNLANQIVIPLIIGVGLAYGIHIIHRFNRQKPDRRDITDVLVNTGGAITLSGLTTMIGFGSLALASHRGLASIGTVLFFGVGAALVASTYVLANILYLLYRPKR